MQQPNDGFAIFLFLSISLSLFFTPYLSPSLALPLYLSFFSILSTIANKFKFHFICGERVCLHIFFHILKNSSMVFPFLFYLLFCRKQVFLTYFFLANIHSHIIPQINFTFSSHFVLAYFFSICLSNIN